MNEWNGKERRDCGGCLVTETHAKLSDERWELIVKGIKIGAWAVGGMATIFLFVFTVASGGLGFLLRDINTTISESNIKIDKLTEKISENTTVSAVTKQELSDHKSNAKDSIDFLKNQNKNRAIDVQLLANKHNKTIEEVNDIRRKVGGKVVLEKENTKPFNPPEL